MNEYERVILVKYAFKKLPKCSSAVFIHYLTKNKNDTNAAEYPQKTPLSRRVKVVSFFC